MSKTRMESVRYKVSEPYILCPLLECLLLPPKVNSFCTAGDMLHQQCTRIIRGVKVNEQKMISNKVEALSTYIK
jgi:hypothetical protein